jgi:hypothetical protein
MSTSTQLQLLDLSGFAEQGQQLNATYLAAKPFPHIVMDDFLPVSVLDAVLGEFPTPQALDWRTYENREEKKLASKSEGQLGNATRLLLYQLNSSPFLSFLENLTGIQGLLPDPHFWGGGLHQIQPGGYLKVHVDFNNYKRLNALRRLNLLIYLNKDWSEEYGGNLELWNQDMSTCVQRILPIFNRCVIFGTTDTSYHGHPEPLTCPPDRTRKSLAMYYYTSSASELSGELHGTLFRARPGETVRTDQTRRFLKRLAPPILLDAWRALKGSGSDTI